MAIHSTVLAWRILWTEKPGRLQSRGSQNWTELKRLSMHTHALNGNIGMSSALLRNIYESVTYSSLCFLPASFWVQVQGFHPLNFMHFKIQLLSEAFILPPMAEDQPEGTSSALPKRVLRNEQSVNAFNF